MKNSNLRNIVLLFILVIQSSFSQVDVLYNDLVWSDEFSTNGTVNSSNWFHQTQLPDGGSWFNGEVQHYTNQLTNSNVNAGFLNIVAKKEPYTNQGITKQYTSARLNSKFAFLYGRVDVRAKLPLDAGTWPAIWMLAKNINENGGFFDTQFGTVDWPACGEIDIIEHGITPSQPINYIQSALHTTSSFGNTTNIGGTIASDLANSFHTYSMNWSANQISFLLDGVVYYTYNPAIKNANNWPFNSAQYILLNIAMGGVAGAINPNYTQSAMVVDYVRVYQNTAVDTQSPTNFTATLGTVTGTTAQLLLNGNDNSGNLTYTITYGAQTLTAFGTSGIQKSVIIPNLTPNTFYTFSIAASDATGNNAANNSLSLNATTTQVFQCSGTSNTAQQGSFSTGYSYTFETIGTDVKITCQLLDTDKTGVIAYLWKQSPFSETQMTNVSGTTFTKTITGQTIGATISYGVKFAFAGGLAVTSYIPYVVGSNCSLTNGIFENDKQFSFTNPSDDFVEIDTSLVIDKVEIYNLVGNLVLKTSTDTKKIDVTNLTEGVYFLMVYSNASKYVKKLIVK
jgi:beta-glucanase (GH16 family)